MNYRDNVLILLDNILTKARIFREKFDSNEALDELLLYFNLFEADYNCFIEAVPKDFNSNSDLKRHFYWLKRYLNQGKPSDCYSDITNICENDIEQYRNDYLKYLSEKDIDKELNDKVFVLLQTNNCDSAVRKAFVVLTERLRKIFSQPPDIDGCELVNNIFGGKGILINKIGKEERESLRNLLDGMYGTYRNKYMHNDLESNINEAEAIISMINLMIKKAIEIKDKI